MTPIFLIAAMFSSFPRAAARVRSLTCVIDAMSSFLRRSGGRYYRHKPRSLAVFTKLLRQFRQRLIKVGDQPVVGDLENRRLLVLVDRHDHLGVLHAGEMLNRARD